MNAGLQPRPPSGVAATATAALRKRIYTARPATPASDERRTSVGRVRPRSRMSASDGDAVHCGKLRPRKNGGGGAGAGAKDGFTARVIPFEDDEESVRVDAAPQPESGGFRARVLLPLEDDNIRVDKAAPQKARGSRLRIHQALREVCVNVNVVEQAAGSPAKGGETAHGVGAASGNTAAAWRAALDSMAASQADADALSQSLREIPVGSSPAKGGDKSHGVGAASGNTAAAWRAALDSMAASQADADALSHAHRPNDKSFREIPVGSGQRSCSAE
jgi:hypothetical protein